jgi:hypothetical protein
MAPQGCVVLFLGRHFDLISFSFCFLFLGVIVCKDQIWFSKSKLLYAILIFEPFKVDAIRSGLN